MSYHECKVFEGPDGCNLCIDGEGCFAAEKLQHDLVINPTLRVEAQMTRIAALSYVKRCEDQGCKCIVELTEVAMLFPEANSPLRE